MKINLLGHKTAPKLIKDSVKSLAAQETEQPAVFVILFGDGSVRIGSGPNLMKALTQEVKNGPAKGESKNHKAWVLENNISTKAERKMLRNKWIRFFYQKAPKGKVLNALPNAGDKLKFTQAKDGSWKSNMEAVLHLRNPAKRVYRVHGSKIAKFFGLPPRKGSFFTVIDDLKHKGWYIMGLAYYGPKTLPPDEWAEFIKDKETIKAKKLQAKK
jgi:hypothetical protein